MEGTYERMKVPKSSNTNSDEVGIKRKELHFN